MVVSGIYCNFATKADYRRHLSIEPKQTFQTGLISIIYVEHFKSEMLHVLY